jgi:lipoate-protein ligase A
MNTDALKTALTQAFCDTFGAELRPGTLREEEKALAQKLLDEKYTTEAWNVHGKEQL